MRIFWQNFFKYLELSNSDSAQSEEFREVASLGCRRKLVEAKPGEMQSDILSEEWVSEWMSEWVRRNEQMDIRRCEVLRTRRVRCQAKMRTSRKRAEYQVIIC